MRPCVLVFLLFLCSVVSSRAQDVLRQDSLFSLSIELKKPNGKIDRDAYVLMTVHNKMDQDLYMLKGGNGFEYPQLHSFFSVQTVDRANKLETYFCGTCFQLHIKKRYYLPAHGVYQEKLPIKIYYSGMSATGFLGPKNMNNHYLKVRALIKDFVVGSTVTSDVYMANLTSNWLDISDEDFSEIEEK